MDFIFSSVILLSRAIYGSSILLLILSSIPKESRDKERNCRLMDDVKSLLCNGLYISQCRGDHEEGDKTYDDIKVFEDESKSKPTPGI